MDLFKSDTKTQRFLGTVRLDSLEQSPLNPRKTRNDNQIAALVEHIQSAGYDVTRAVKVHRINNKLYVFAGGTRLLASRQAGLTHIPAFEFIGYSDDELWRFAYDDNTADGKHTTLPITDIWADYAERYASGKTQQQIADALGISQTRVGFRIRWHEQIKGAARKAVVDGIIDEGHLEAIAGVVVDVDYLQPWLTTETAQQELLDEVLGKHRGSSEGIKPTVQVVRKAAAKWKAMIEAAEKAVNSLSSDEDGDKWVSRFVSDLVAKQARTEADVSYVLEQVIRMQERAAQAKKDSADKEQSKKRKEAERLTLINTVTAKVLHGDAQELITKAPQNFHLLLTDPPYGIAFQSQRRKITSKKEIIKNDNEQAFSVLSNTLQTAFHKMNDNSTALIFTDWEHEPKFRDIILAVGFVIKGSLIWVKANHGTGDLQGSFAPKHERIIHAVKGSPVLKKRHPDVLSGQNKQNGTHPTEKPQDLLRLLIEATTDPGDVVVDPFSGSGSTLLAAYDTDRDFFGCELDDTYFKDITNALYKRATATTEKAAHE